MEYSKILELAILKFLRVRIGQRFTPEELYKEITKVCPATEEDFHIMLRILEMEELIATLRKDDAPKDIKEILYITKDGLKLLREKKQ
jgi:hypothetical protein